MNIPQDEKLGDEAASMNYEDVQPPSFEKILEMINGMEGLTDEEKNSLLRDVMRQSQGGLGMPPHDAAATGNVSGQFFTLLSLIFLIALIFVFFGYKLYKSLVEKEKRREEKRRQKQMKKKK